MVKKVALIHHKLPKITYPSPQKIYSSQKMADLATLLLIIMPSMQQANPEKLRGYCLCHYPLFATTVAVV